MRIFLGITGASGAPYAARLLQALSAAGAEVGLTVSDSGFEVLATELYGDASLPEDEVLRRLTAGLDGVTYYPKDDYKNPYASGSAKVDGYVVCPCSMATLGTIAAGAMANLVHRAASVALKEGRRLVLVPRETPLSERLTSLVKPVEFFHRLHVAGEHGGDEQTVFEGDSVHPKVSQGNVIGVREAGVVRGLARENQGRSTVFRPRHIRLRVRDAQEDLLRPRNGRIEP